MTPASRLIVALDGDPITDTLLFCRLSIEAGVTFFKLRARTFLQRRGWELAQDLRGCGHSLFLDLKLNDTLDSVQGDLETALFFFNPVYVTIDARRVHPAHLDVDRTRLLALDALTTDGGGAGRPLGAVELIAGLVCHPLSAGYYRALYPLKTIVCPAIRPAWHAVTDNHSSPVTPAQAIQNGADYLVVGRPITASPDPGAAARRIIAEIEAAAGPAAGNTPDPTPGPTPENA